MILVVKGRATAKEIEHLFMNLLGADAWRRTARPITDSTFVMRFPTTKMVKEWSHIRNMSMKGGEAQIQIDPWASSSNSKGELRQGWFRVTNIPGDHRSIITLAKVGALVGEAIEIDLKARFRVDYVRIKIACRDVSKIPKTTEGVLGMTMILGLKGKSLKKAMRSFSRVALRLLRINHLTKNPELSWDLILSS